MVCESEHSGKMGRGVGQKGWWRCYKVSSEPPTFRATVRQKERERGRERESASAAREGGDGRPERDEQRT